MENALDAAGETMLHRAARNGHAHVVEALSWSYDADIDLCSWTDGSTALHLAAEAGGRPRYGRPKMEPYEPPVYAASYAALSRSK